MKGIIIIYILISIILGIAAVQDVKKKEINILYIGMILIMAVVGLFYKDNIKVLDIIGGISVGIGLIIISLLSKEQIGLGDGMIMAAVGIILGLKYGIVMLCIASLIQSLISIAILISKKGNRNTKIPFVPSLFLGYVGSVLLIL